MKIFTLPDIDILSFFITVSTFRAAVSQRSMGADRQRRPIQPSKKLHIPVDVINEQKTGFASFSLPSLASHRRYKFSFFFFFLGTENVDAMFFVSFLSDIRKVENLQK